jgi:hypothetical protein
MCRPEAGAYNSVSTPRGYLELLLAYSYSTKEFQSNDTEEKPFLKKIQNLIREIFV